MRDPLITGDGKVHSQANTDGETNIRKFGDYSKNFAPRSEEEHEFDTVVKYLNNLQDFPLKVAIWKQFMSDCLWASFWLSKNHEDFKRVAMNQKCQNIKFITVRVATSESTDRPQRCIQYAGIAGLENMSLVKNALAE